MNKSESKVILLLIFITVIVCILLSVAIFLYEAFPALEEGTEEVYYGTVIDRAMSEDGAYIGIKTDDMKEHYFLIEKKYHYKDSYYALKNNGKGIIGDSVGDYVKLTTMLETVSVKRVVTHAEVIKEN